MSSGNRKSTLTHILVALVDGWGYDEVSRHLARIRPGGLALSAETTIAAEKKKSRHRPTAVDYVKRLEVTDRRRELLLKIATQFDERRLLPSLGDVQHYLSMQGGGHPHLRDRSEAFRRILEVILNAPDERLERMARDNAHSGPLQLGPLSEAIRETSAAIRSEGTNLRSEVSEPRSGLGSDVSKD